MVLFFRNCEICCLPPQIEKIRSLFHFAKPGSDKKSKQEAVKRWKPGRV
jgi:hypothetical protein